jgi:hypothetical protein
MLKKCLFASLAVYACYAQSSAGRGPVYKLLYAPSNLLAPGGNPTVMFEAEPGLFYVLGYRSTSSFGSSVFTVTSEGAFKVIYSLPANIDSGTLVQGGNGRLYGPGNPTGSGTSPSYNYYYSILPAGSGLQQYAFTGTWGSGAEMLAAPPGEFYDIIGTAGNKPVWGFGRLDENGKIILLHQFSASDGIPSGSNIVYGSDGNIYGIGNQQGVQAPPGFIFRFTPSGAYSQLVSFPQPSIGYSPIYLPLIAASDGNLYGVLKMTGANNTGQIYQATLSGQLQTVASFPAKGMTRPQSLMQASDGNLYGSASNYIFRYNLTTRQLSGVYELNPNTSQGECPCKLIEGMDGKLYGVTPIGGSNQGIGAVFSLDIGLPKPTPVISGLYPASGPAGQNVTLWGNYLLGATSVTFNGVPAASVASTSVQSVRVTVPAGATTGPVTITTANGSFTTSQDFTVQ